MRETSAGTVSIMAGCFVCNNGDAQWFAKNALAVAARHHDATGHTTWCESVLSVRYGRDISLTPDQADLKSEADALHYRELGRRFDPPPANMRGDD